MLFGLLRAEVRVALVGGGSYVCLSSNEKLEEKECRYGRLN